MIITSGTLSRTDAGIWTGIVIPATASQQFGNNLNLKKIKYQIYKSIKYPNSVNVILKTKKKIQIKNTFKFIINVSSRFACIISDE